MADTYTAVGLIKQSSGSNSGTWGTELNTNEDISTLLVGGVSTQSITTTDVTPANVNGVADAGKSLTFVCSGVLTGNRNLILPTVARPFIVTNNCTGAFTLTVKTVAGTGIVVPQGGSMLLYCDGTNIVQGVNTTGISSGTVANGGTGQTTYTDGQLLIGNSSGNTLSKSTLTAGSGISVTNGNGFISIAATGGSGTVTSVSVTTANGVSGSVATSTTTPAITLTLGAITPSSIVSAGNVSYTGQSFGNVFTLTDASTIAWNMNSGGIASVTLGASRIMGAPTNIQAGGTYALRVIQDATGSRLITWNAAFKWPSGTAPTLSTAANAVDLVTFISYDGSTLYGVEQGAFA